MKPYWNKMLNPHPGMLVREIENKYGNVYIKDEYGRVWQIWFVHEGPQIQLVAHEDNSY